MVKLKRKTTKRILTVLFYGAIGFVASLALFLVFYWSLRLNASIDNLVRNYYGPPFYFWPYVAFTIGTIVLFGINVPLLVYRYRRYGFPTLRHQAGGGLGAVIGVFASACPVCGSTLLSAIGIAGGLAAFPLGGLELKALSFGLMALPIALTGRELSRFSKGGEECPVPHDASFTKNGVPLLMVLGGVLFILLWIGVRMLASDPIVHIVKQIGWGNIDPQSGVGAACRV